MPTMQDIRKQRRVSRMSERKGRGDIHITNNYYAPIGQHIDHVDTLNFRMDGDGTFHFGHVEEITGNGSVSSDENQVTQDSNIKEVMPTIHPDLPPADVFVNRVKDIVTRAARKNGETIPANPRGLAGEYTFFVDGGRISKMMDDLRKNHEAKINEFLCCTSKYDGVMIVAPFIGRLLQMEELRARDLQLTDLEFAFSPYYTNTASAVKRMSTKLESAEANMLFSLLKGMLKKYPKG